MKHSAIVLALLCSGVAPAVLAQSPDTTDQAMKLPRVVLIGDSIRLSYAPTVIRELEGRAQVVSPKANGGDSSNLVKHLDQWVIRQRPAVVHFNCGIHDTKKFKATGEFQVSPAEYEKNLRTIVKRIRTETSAIVLFASTTPILDDRAASTRQERDYELLDSSVQQYNAIALRVMRELKVPVDDLYTSVSRPEGTETRETRIGSDGVHLTPAAQQSVGKTVVSFISKQLFRSEVGGDGAAYQ